MTEAILEPGLPIVDPHHHFWDRPGMVGADLPPPKHGFESVLRMAPRYLLDELLADMKRAHNVVATVYMECGSFYRAGAEPHLRCVGETEAVNGYAAVSASNLYGEVRACAGIVGTADLKRGEAAREVLEAHMDASYRFRGVRQSASADADPEVLGPLHRQEPGLYLREDFRQGFAQLAPLGLSFDAWMLEPQLPDLISLTRAFEETTVVLDHVGTPLGLGTYAGKREERFGVWRDNIRELAKSPNVQVKLGGLAMVFPNFPSFLSNPAAPSEQLAAEWKPYIETCIEAFGAERCMFESNFPVDLGSCTYDVLWNAFKVIAKDYSATEKTALFSGTATKVYRLDLS